MIYLDFWIIRLLLTWRDYETKSLGWGGPISSNQSYQVSMQSRPWLERSDQEPLVVPYTNWDQNETEQKGRKVETKTVFSEQTLHNIKI